MLHEKGHEGRGRPGVVAGIERSHRGAEVVGRFRFGRGCRGRWRARGRARRGQGHRAALARRRLDGRRRARASRRRRPCLRAPSVSRADGHRRQAAATSRMTPVIHPASSDARKTAARATSSGVPRRWMGCALASSASFGDSLHVPIGEGRLRSDAVDADAVGTHPPGWRHPES
jgi:hypothetical protein